MSQPSYGFREYLDHALEAFEWASRRSGRTERILADVRPGDVIVCGLPSETNRLRQVLRERRIKGVRVVYADPCRDLRDHHALAMSREATVLDHNWMRLRYLHVLADAAAQISAELAHIQGEHLGLEPWPDRFFDELAFRTYLLGRP